MARGADAQLNIQEDGTGSELGGGKVGGQASRNGFQLRLEQVREALVALQRRFPMPESGPLLYTSLLEQG